MVILFSSMYFANAASVGANSVKGGPPAPMAAVLNIPTISTSSRTETSVFKLGERRATSTIVGGSSTMSIA